MIARYYINGQEVQRPINHSAIKYRIEFDQEFQTQSLSVSELEWGVADLRDKKDAKVILREIVNKGLSGGVGITEGVPLKIVLDSERGETIDVFNGYINLWDSQFDVGNVIAPIQQSGSLDWFNDQIDSFSFDYLESIGLLTSDNYQTIPYCIEKKQNNLEMIILVVSVFVITDKLAYQTYDLTKLLARSANPFTSPSASVEVLACIVYIAVLLAALIGLLLQLFENIIQRNKYHYGMKVADMMEIGLKHLGYTFRSSIFQNSVYKDLILLPEKYQVGTNTGILSAIEGLVKENKRDQKGYFKGTFGDFIRAFKTMFNAKLVIDSSVSGSPIFYFEKYNFRKSESGITIPELWGDSNKFAFNYSDFKSNIKLAFMIDQQDRHTVKEYAGTSVQVIQKQKAVNNRQMVLTKGYDERNIPFALGKKKTSLSNTEIVLRGLFETVQPVMNLIIETANRLITVINAVLSALRSLVKALRRLGIRIKIEVRNIPKISKVNVSNQITNRIGMLKMESDYVAIPKLLFLENGKIVNEEYLNARYLFDQFHVYGLFVARNDFPANQYLIKDAKGIPFLFEQTKEVLKNNAIFTERGEKGEIISIEAGFEDQTADIDYKILKQYTNNIELQYLEPNGN